MLSAVQLYDNPRIEGNKIYNVCFNWLLPAKFDTFKLTVSYIPPEHAFCVSAIIT
jgi:hypothetical protein